MEWLLLFFFMPFVLTLMFFNWLEQKFFAFRDREKLEDGEKMLQEKKYAEAQAFPKSPKAFMFRGQANLGLENYYSALFDFEQSISFDNTVAESYVWKGKALYKLEEYDQAFLEFDKADWYYRSENAVALRWRGMARYCIGQIENSVNDFKRAVELGDEDSDFILSTKFNYIRRKT
jgi:tetratricopeptide (TPR) repeat protein